MIPLGGDQEQRMWLLRDNVADARAAALAVMKPGFWTFWIDVFNYFVMTGQQRAYSAFEQTVKHHDEWAGPWLERILAGWDSDLDRWVAFGHQLGETYAQIGGQFRGVSFAGLLEGAGGHLYDTGVAVGQGIRTTGPWVALAVGLVALVILVKT